MPERAAWRTNIPFGEHGRMDGQGRHKFKVKYEETTRIISIQTKLYLLFCIQ